MGDDASLGRRWDWHYLTRSEHPNPPLPIVECVVERAERAGRILYVGYGDGRNASALLRAGLDVYSCDLSAYAVDVARKAFPGHEHRFECATASESFAAVPRFDHLVLSRVLIHDSFAASRSRVRGVVQRLRAGGHLYVQWPAIGTDLWPGWTDYELDQGGNLSLGYAQATERKLYLSFSGVVATVEDAGLSFVDGPRAVDLPRQAYPGGIVRNWLGVAVKQ